jgi:hypothetical protein
MLIFFYLGFKSLMDGDRKPSTLETVISNWVKNFSIIKSIIFSKKLQ